MSISKQIAKELKIGIDQVENTIKLIDEGNTIPFIARYRKEAHGSLDDIVLRELESKLDYLRKLEEKKVEIKNSLEKLGFLDKDLEAALEKAESLSEIEDIYRPYRPKKTTRASKAIEKGLSPLADQILMQKTKKNGHILASEFYEENKESLSLESADDCLQGASDIVAERISDMAEIRKRVRAFYILNSQIRTQAKEEIESIYSNYYDFNQPTIKIADHRILAINRGEKENFLKVNLEANKENILNIISKFIIKEGSSLKKDLEAIIEDSYTRLIEPSIQREIRASLTERAVEGALKNFSSNLKELLMQKPLKGKTILGIDPAYRTGCKYAIVDQTSKILDTGVIYPTPPHNKIEEGKKILKEKIGKHKVSVIAIGNGTASQETEIFVGDLLKELEGDYAYTIVNEAGASVYSASKLASEEFPNYDVSIRSAISIARRLQDPLAELVKIDPKAVGVGQYQHDMPAKLLDSALKSVVEDSVNKVGVDLNTASFAILAYISGINQGVAKEIVNYREEKGLFRTRKELLKVPKLGAKSFEMSAGFLRIAESDNFLDNTQVHPESYQAATKLLDLCQIKSKEELQNIRARVKDLGLEKLAKEIGVGVPTLKDIIIELEKPGRDIRDDLEGQTLRTKVLSLEDLYEGMVLEGTVRNVIDFGAFVDIGVSQDGLVHISQISNTFIKHPSEVLKVSDKVKVKIIKIDQERKRISLSMKEL